MRRRGGGRFEACRSRQKRNQARGDEFGRQTCRRALRQRRNERSQSLHRLLPGHARQIDRFFPRIDVEPRQCGNDAQQGAISVIANGCK